MPKTVRLEWPHPFLECVDSYLDVQHQRKRLDLINSISKRMGYADGAVTNIPVTEVERAAKLIVELDLRAARHFSAFLTLEQEQTL